MKPTDRLIVTFNHVIENGLTEIRFYVGKFTGYGPGVIQALRKRGYTVSRSAKDYWILSK